MKRVLVSFVLMFLILGFAFSGMAIASEDDNRSENYGSSNTGSSESEDETETEDDESEEEEREEDNSGTSEKDETKINIREDRTEVEIRKRVINEDGSVEEVRIEIKIRNNEDGETKREIEVEGRKGVIYNARTKLEIESVKDGNETELEVELSDGNKSRIKVLPDRASEIARERFKARNISLELKELNISNVPRVVYHIQTNKTGRFLGIFKMELRIEGEIDSETGEILSEQVPWWAPLLFGDDIDLDEDDGLVNETVVENSTNTTV